MLIALDFETTGLNFWAPDFIVTHMACYTADNEVIIITDRVEMLEYLRVTFIDNPNTMLVYNLGFELGVLYHLLADGAFCISYIDVMRLRQYAGIEQEHESFGLKDAVIRFLHEESQDIPLKEYCKKQGWKSDFRNHLYKMPKEMVINYVYKDARSTYLLGLLFIKKYDLIQYNWKKDHDSFYLPLVKQVVLACYSGLQVNKKQLEEYIYELNRLQDDNKHQFREQNAEGIFWCENFLWEEKRAKRKTEKGKNTIPRPIFNENSTKQLQLLFTEFYKIPIKYFTTSGQASFASDKILQFPQAEPLKQNKKLGVVETQCQNLLDLTAIDGLYHQNLKVCGTITGRLAGAGGLNIQGLARRDKKLMSSIISKKGFSFVSTDGSAIEPTITAEYSKDRNYTYAVYDGIGKPPYWENDTLFIDDIYLMFLSKLSFGRTKLQELYEQGYEDKTFAEQWLSDCEVIKSQVKPLRNLAKTIVLGLSYGMGAGKLATTLKEKGYEITKAESKVIYTSYWRLFDGINNLKQKVQSEADRNNNFLINPFGYGAKIDNTHKALNFFIQSSVNPIMVMYLKQIQEILPKAEFVTIIHDELILQIHDSLLEELRVTCKQAMQNVNKILKEQYNWTLSLRAGFAYGKTLYEAK